MSDGYWKHIDNRGDYYIWVSRDKTFQLTKGPTPPDSTAGYYSLEALLQRKGSNK